MARRTHNPDLDHPLLHAFGVQKLLDTGFIDVPNLPTAPLLPQTPIHPVFRYPNWRGLPQVDYILISPVLRLASRILDCPQTLPFFIGLLERPLQPFWNADVARRFGSVQYWFSQRFVEDAGGYYHDLAVDAWQKMQVMKDAVTLEFARTTGKKWAYTQPVGTGPLPGTASSRIVLDSQYLEVLQGIRRAQDFPTARALGLDPAAALLRTQLHMATVLCHEFCHALDIAFNQRPPSPNEEPFYRGDTVAELGWAFQQQIFDGVVEPICGVARDLTFPYGIHNRLFPGPTTRKARSELRSPAAAGVTHFMYFAISMDYVKRFFTEAFWDRQVNQYGVACLSADLHGVACVRLRSGLHERLYLGEPYWDPMDYDEIVAGVVPYTG